MHPRLLLFFAGWGMDENPFRDYTPVGCDFMICYDYRTLDFNENFLAPYSSIRLVAWSMGVWVASQVFSRSSVCFDDSLAVNGTVYPVDDKKGIPTSVFKGTLNGLNEVNYKKFLRRMCGTGDCFNEFINNPPQRTIQELKDELESIGTNATCLDIPAFSWSRAIVGNKDLIFLPENQARGWEGTEVLIREIAHYDSELWKELLS